jgi:hypothetical protein
LALSAEVAEEFPLRLGVNFMHDPSMGFLQTGQV